MTSQGSGIGHSRASAAVSPPEGATLASFVLFASLATLIAFVYLGSEWWNLAGSFGFSSDAAWARAVFARNLASGQGLCFNPGVPAAGAPGSSWIAALAVFGVFTGKFVTPAKVAGILSVVGAAYFVWHITFRLLGDWRFAFLAGLLVAGSPRLAADALGGTEAAFAALLVLAAIYWQAVGWEGSVYKRALCTAAAGLAALSRPELILLLPMLLADRWGISLVHEEPGKRLRGGFLRSVPEFFGALAVITPFLVYNARFGGPIWQQPEFALRPPGTWAWTGLTLDTLFYDNAVLYVCALVGIPIAIVSAVRPHSRHPSLLLPALPLVILLGLGFGWDQAGAENAFYTAAYLTPLLTILGVCGLFLAHRAARQLLDPSRDSKRRAVFAAAIGLTCFLACALPVLRHPVTWRAHGFNVKKVSDLQGFLGRWAADHLPADASIASREVGAIGFFSGKRMVDLGGTISSEGLAALSQPGSPDTHLLMYLQQARPSHVAIRPSDFPDLTQRPDVLTPAVTCVVTDPVTGGVTTMGLYETPWPPLSIVDARARTGRR
jgi:hypothetical protein